METKIFTKEGKEAGKFTLPEAIFSAKWNPDLVHEVVVSMQANARQSTANAKDRSEVSGGGKKPWRQKGTGRARHGSRRSPIWRGGGVAHGPTSEKDYSKKINKKVRQKALAVTLSKKFADGEVLLVEDLNFTEPKTALAKATIKALATGANKADLATKRKNAALVVLSGRHEAAEKSFRNFGNLLVSAAKDINPVQLLTYKYVIIAEPKEAIATIEKRLA